MNELVKKQNARTETQSRLTVDDLVAMYRLMLLSRRFTEQGLEWYREGRLPHGLHPSIGQEAIGVGACYGLRPGDWVLPSLRTTEAFWTRGVTLLEQLNAEIGNTGSPSRGKEASHHAAYPEKGILPGTAVVGGSIPVAVGAALALKMQGTDSVVITFFGDGASNRGDFHEALNLAAVLKAPVVFVCENNGYAQTVPVEAATAVRDIADRAAGYGIPGRILDGQDIEVVHEAVQEAVARARRGGGPTLLECKTHRFRPHHPFFEEDRSAEDLARCTARDPIEILGGRLRQKGFLDEALVKRMEREIAEELEEAIHQAEALPLPDPQEGFGPVCAESLEEMGI